MSWTIEDQMATSLDIESLRKAIIRANAADILMFCSASDHGGNNIGLSYPGEWGMCTRIGGASAIGDKLDWVNEKLVDFLLPGRDIPILNSDGKTYYYPPGGSSLATACASGLAATLLYCDRILGGHYKLNKMDNMKKAFRTLAHDSSKFINVEKNLEGFFKDKAKTHFGRRVDNIKDLDYDDEAETRQSFAELMGHIMDDM